VAKREYQDGAGFVRLPMRYYAGVIRKDNAEVWQCEHQHRVSRHLACPKADELCYDASPCATQCAANELKRRESERG
jgi:hypothetical protein